MVEYSEESALTNSCLERLSSIETKGTERMSSIESQLKKHLKRVNELHRVVEKLVKQDKNGGTQMSDQCQLFSLPDQHKGRDSSGKQIWV